MISVNPPHFESLDLVLTYRCNLSCLNCIRLAGPCGARFALNNDELDLDFEDVRRIVSNIADVGRTIPVRPLIGFVSITGGEPTLHKDLAAFYHYLKAELLDTKLCGDLIINTNGVNAPPKEIPLQVFRTFSTPQQKHDWHVAMFADKGGGHFDECTHYRKWRVVASKSGWLMCCAAEGYIRLAARKDLWLLDLPSNPWDFPIKHYGRICSHCAFCKPGAPFERDVGCPVAPYFAGSAGSEK
jgi:hypothetical protein